MGPLINDKSHVTAAFFGSTRKRLIEAVCNRLGIPFSQIVRAGSQWRLDIRPGHGVTPDLLAKAEDVFDNYPSQGA